MPTKLGQNFLEDKTIAEKIVKAANLRPSDFVIEIGPGKGILTEELAKRAKKVIAIEIDERLADYLRKKFSSRGATPASGQGSASGGANQKNIEIIHADILKMNLLELIENYKLSGCARSGEARQITSYKIIANLPYYATSPIIRLFLETECPPREMILMVQKEVAERITAPPGKMSILSVSVQYYAKPEILFYVNKESFNPVPEVDSAVIRVTQNLKLVTQGNKIKEESQKFFRIVRAGFCARRKTLVNNLSNSLQLDKKETQEKLKVAGISPTTRAQELSVENWKKISSLF